MSWLKINRRPGENVTIYDGRVKKKFLIAECLPEVTAEQARAAVRQFENFPPAKTSSACRHEVRKHLIGLGIIRADVSDALHRLIVARQMRRSTIAKTLGVSQFTICTIMSGVRVPVKAITDGEEMKRLMRGLADMLGVSLTELLKGELTHDEITRLWPDANVEARPGK